MQLEQLEYFLAAARYEHVTNAAKACSISQPALSNALARLENELGVELFDRSGRNIRLNQFGSAFRTHLQLGFAEIDQAVREVREMAGLECGTVALGVDSPELLVRLVCSFMALHPQVHLRESQGNMSGLFRRLEGGQLDLVICERSTAAAELDWTPLAEDRFVLLVPKEHRLAGQASAAPGDLAEERLVCTRPGVGLRDTLDLLLHAEGLDPAVIFEGDDTDTIEQLVAQGCGVTVVSGLALRINGGTKSSAVVQIPLTGESCSRTLGVYTRQNHFMSQSAELFLEHVKTFFGAYSMT